MGVSILLLEEGDWGYINTTTGVRSSVPGWYWLIVECRKCGGGGVTRATILALSMLEEVLSLLLISLRGWLSCGLIDCRMDVVLAWAWLSWNGGRRIGGAIGGGWLIIFSLFRVSRSVSFCLVIFHQSDISYCILLSHTYHFIISSFSFFVDKILPFSIVATIVVSPY